MDSEIFKNKIRQTSQITPVGPCKQEENKGMREPDKSSLTENNKKRETEEESFDIWRKIKDLSKGIKMQKFT
jgi:hypothetical protein